MSIMDAISARWGKDKVVVINNRPENVGISRCLIANTILHWC